MDPNGSHQRESMASLPKKRKQPTDPDHHRQRAIDELKKAKDAMAKFVCILHQAAWATEGTDQVATLLCQVVLKGLDEGLFFAMTSAQETPAESPPHALVAAASTKKGRLSTNTDKNLKGGPPINRRKGALQVVWSEVTANPDNDYPMWRIYGNKEISGSKHRRSYYRCTNYKEGCFAVKHAQQVNSSTDQPMFQVTYFGQHNCGISTNVTNSLPSAESFGWINWNVENMGMQREQQHVLSPLIPFAEKECEGEKLLGASESTDDHQYGSCSANLAMIEDLLAAPESPGGMSADNDWVIVDDLSMFEKLKL